MSIQYIPLWHRHYRVVLVHAHAPLIRVYVIAGKFYTLATGANERRWGKMKPRLEQVVESFEVSTRYDAVG